MNLNSIGDVLFTEDGDVLVSDDGIVMTRKKNWFVTSTGCNLNAQQVKLPAVKIFPKTPPNIDGIVATLVDSRAPSEERKAAREMVTHILKLGKVL